jgi:FixJ family two-component response regulator
MLNKDNIDEAPFIAVVDDDASVRYSTRRLLRAFGFRSEAFASASEFLNSGHFRDTSCLILDVRMHGMSGLALQRHLTEMNYSIPIIFVAGGAEENERVRAMQRGAVHFLRKPTNEQSLIKAVETALTPESCLCRELSITVNRSVTHVH